MALTDDERDGLRALIAEEVKRQLAPLAAQVAKLEAESAQYAKKGDAETASRAAGRLRH